MAKVEPTLDVLRKVVLEIFLIAGLTISIFAMKSFWKPFQRGFFCNDESLMYPYHEDTITTPMLRVYSLAIPMLVMLICEWVLLRKEPSYVCVLGVSLPAWVCGVYCAVVSFGLGACFVDFATEISKHVIGRPRPHFFDFYLERRVTWHGTRVFRHTLQFGAFTMSWFTALSRVTDYKHHWSDVLAGYGLGLAFAVLMWNWGTELVEKKKSDSSVSQGVNVLSGTAHMS